MITFFFLAFCLITIIIAIYALVELVRLSRRLRLWKQGNDAFERITRPFLAYLATAESGSEEEWQAYCEAHGIDYTTWRAEAALHHAQVVMPGDQKGGEE